MKRVMLKVFLHQINENISYEEKAKTLPIFIQKKIAKRKNRQKAIASLVGYLLLQKVLKENFDIDLESMKYLASGKPYFPKNDCFFSISHSQDLVGVALSDKADIGLDIEHHRLLEIKDNSFAFFSSIEKEAIMKEEEPTLKMIELWSKKEALIKAVGGRMFDMANHTDLRYQTTIWNQKEYYLQQLGEPPSIHIWIAMPQTLPFVSTEKLLLI